MARYIDADKLIEALRVDFEREGAKAYDMAIKGIADASIKYSHGQFCYLNAIEQVKVTPTADVAQKSEVDKLKATIERLEQEKEEMLVSATTDIPITMETLFKVRTEHPIVTAIEAEVARVIFEKIKRSKVMLGHPAKIICFRATPTGEVEETVEGWVVPQSRIEELEKKYVGGKTDEDISD